MLTPQLRKRLVDQMNLEPQVRSWFVLTRCGAGLAIIALIASIGISAGERGDNVAQVKNRPQVAQPAAEHRRQVFEQRRAAFEQGGRGHLAEQLPGEKTGLMTLE